MSVTCKAVALIAAIVGACLAVILLMAWLMPVQVIMTIRATTPTQLNIFYLADGMDTYKPVSSITTHLDASEYFEEKKFYLPRWIDYSRLRLDFGDVPDRKFEISSLEIRKMFVVYKLDAAALKQCFSVLHQAESTLSAESFIVNTTGNDPYIVSSSQNFQAAGKCFYNYSAMMKFLFGCIAVGGFVLLLTKMKTWFKHHRSTVESGPNWIDYSLWSGIAVLCFLFFQQGDLFATSLHSMQMLEVIQQGRFFSFYSYTKEQGLQAFYSFPIYIAFGIWELPLFLIRELCGVTTGRLILVFWCKLLNVLLFVLSGLLIRFLAAQLNVNSQSQKWSVYLWLTSPLAFYSIFIFGQYDILFVILLLCAMCFFFQRKLWIFTVIMAMSVCFKNFALFAFIPLILFAEKRIMHLIGHFALVCSGAVVATLIFWSDPVAHGTGEFAMIIVGRILRSSFPAAIAPASYFATFYALLCFFCYFYKTDIDEKFRRTALYIPLCAYGVLFIFTNPWHPQWLIVLVPFMVLNILLQEQTRNRVFLYIDGVIFCSFVVLSILQFKGIVDHNLFRRGGILGGYGYNWGTKMASQALTMEELFKLIPHVEILASSIFVAGILFYLLVFFPGWNWKLNIKNIAWGRCDVWWRFASVFFFIIPATICFLYSSYREERVLNNVRLPSGFLLNWEKTGNSPLKIFKKRAVIVSTLSGKDNLGEITSGRNILVPLSLRQIPIRGVELQLATYNRKNSGQTVFRFLSEEKKILWEKSINNVDVADCKFFKIMFPHRLPVAFLEITANDTRKGNAITCLVSGKGTDNPPNQVKSWKPNCRYLL